MRYFFRRLDGDFDPDREGTECASLQAARNHAVSYAATTLGNSPNWTGSELRVEVIDDRGMLAATLVLLAIDTKDPAEKIHVTRTSDSQQNPEPLFVVGSGHAWRRQRGPNK